MSHIVSYCFNCHLIARSGTVIIDSTLALVKISLKALLAVSLVEYGIQHAKETSGLDKML